MAQLRRLLDVNRLTRHFGCDDGNLKVRKTGEARKLFLKKIVARTLTRDRRGWMAGGAEDGSVHCGAIKRLKILEECFA